MLEKDSYHSSREDMFFAFFFHDFLLEIFNMYVCVKICFHFEDLV